MPRDTAFPTCDHPDVQVVVSSLTGWYFDFPFVNAWDDMREYDLGGCGHTSMVKGGGRIFVTASVAFAGRNDIVDQYLTKYPKAEYLLQADADMGGWTPDSICKLIATAKAHDAKVVSGLAFGGGRTVCFPTIYERYKQPVFKADGTEHTAASVRPVEDIPKGPVEVGATGGAFLLVHRDVFVAVKEAFGVGPDGYPNPHPWFQHVVLKGLDYGEDTTFCMRAAACGFTTWVDPAIETNHWKHLPLDRRMYDSGGRLQWEPHPAWPTDRASRKRRERAKQ